MKLKTGQFRRYPGVTDPTEISRVFTDDSLQSQASGYDYKASSKYDASDEATSNFA